MDGEKERRIMCLGLCCVDIISICESFPQEDTDQRSLDYYWQRGGNASNSASVLSHLGANVEYFGTLVSSQELRFLEEDFTRHNIHIDNCVRHEEGRYRCPVAVVIISKQTASRTIMASTNKCAQVQYEEFLGQINLNLYKWIHFEGCPNNEDIKKMIEHINSYNSQSPGGHKVIVSLELEKPKRPELLQLIGLVDYVFVSKDFGLSQGHRDKVEVVEKMLPLCKLGATIICAWGDQGAAAKTTSCDTVISPVFPPEALVDTLGAGDTFNGATIFALSKGHSLQDAIVFACKVAGAKCGMVGYEGIKGMQLLLT